MSDDLDAIAKAVNLNKKLAAKLVVRKEALEADIARAQSEGRGVEPLMEELATTRQDLAAALKEIDALRLLAGKSGVGIADDSLEMSALDRARDDINALAGGEVASGPRKPSKEEADAQALREFEALREGKPKTKKTM